MFLNAVQAESIFSLAVCLFWKVSCDATFFSRGNFLFCFLQCGQYEAMCLYYALLFSLLRMAFGFTVVIPTSLITGDFSFYFSAYHWERRRNVAFLYMLLRTSLWISLSSHHAFTYLTTPPFPRVGCQHLTGALSPCDLLICHDNSTITWRDAKRRLVYE